MKTLAFAIVLLLGAASSGQETQSQSENTIRKNSKDTRVLGRRVGRAGNVIVWADSEHDAQVIIEAAKGYHATKWVRQQHFSLPPAHVQDHNPTIYGRTTRKPMVLINGLPRLQNESVVIDVHPSVRGTVTKITLTAPIAEWPRIIKIALRLPHGECDGKCESTLVILRTK